MAKPTPTQPMTDDTGLTFPGLARVLVIALSSNAFLHRAIVAAGPLEFLLHSARTDLHGLGPREYRWVFRELERTCPPPIAAYPDGTVLNEYGQPVPPTPEDLEAYEVIRAVRRTPLVLLGKAAGST